MIERQLVIGKALASDISEVSSILREAAAWLEERGMPLWPASRVSEEAVAPVVFAGEMYLARIDGCGVGVFILQTEDLMAWPDVPAGESLFLHRLAIRRREAGTGLSKAIIDWAVDLAGKEGMRYLRLDCVANRAKLQQFYLSLGFTPRGEWTIHFDVGSDTVLGFDPVIARFELDLTEGAPSHQFDEMDRDR